MSVDWSNLHVAVVSQLELGSHRAHAINVVKTAGGFARLGCQTTLLCLPPKECSPQEALQLYHEPHLRPLCAPPNRFVDFSLESQRAFGRWAREQLETLAPDLVYARHFHAAIEAARAGLVAAMETHAHVGDRNPALVEALREASPAGALAALITISPTLGDHYVSRGADASRVHIVPDGVDVELFGRRRCEPSPLRAIVGDQPAALYSGGLYAYKGVNTLLEAAARRPATPFVLLGGPEEDRTRLLALREQLGAVNAHLPGRVPHAQTPAWLHGAAVLLLPPSADHPSARWTSPVKLGEYLATGKPLVASRIPALAPLLPEPLAHWFTPDDADDLLRALDAAFEEAAQPDADRAQARRRLAQRYAYSERARAIAAAALAQRPACSPSAGR